MGSKIKIGCALAAAMLVFCGCAGTIHAPLGYKGYRQRSDLLVGQSSDELLIQRGEPEKISVLPDGRKEWLYFKTWEYPSAGGVSGSTTETHSETYKDANGKTQSRDVTYEIPIYSTAGAGVMSCETTFIIGPDGKVESYKVRKQLGYWTGCEDYELPTEKKD